MKKVKESNKKPIIVKLDKDLDKYLEKGLFKEKIEKANTILKTVSLPEFRK